MILLNYIQFLYIGLVRPRLMKLMNNIELTNEFLISSISLQLLLFTDFLPDEETRFIAGWGMVGLIITLLVINLKFILFYGGKATAKIA